MAMMGRIMRIASACMETQVADLHKKYDMKLGEFDVLATLRRSGKPQAGAITLVEMVMLAIPAGRSPW